MWSRRSACARFLTSAQTWREERIHPPEYRNAQTKSALAQCLEQLASKEVNLNSIHATASKGGRKAVVVYTVEAETKAVQAA
jgi:hypothetical protein